MRFGDVFVNLCLGMVAMAQGRVQDASAAYGRARQGTRRSFASDPCLTVSTDALAIELDLERNREREIQQRTLQAMSEVRGVWSEVYAAAIAVTAELTFALYSREAAVQLLSRAVDDVRATGIVSLSHQMGALLAQYLVEVERVDDAGRVWRDNGLACEAGELLDLDEEVMMDAGATDGSGAGGDVPVPAVAGADGGALPAKPEVLLGDRLQATALDVQRN